MSPGETDQRQWWNQVRRVTEYAEYLRTGGNPYTRYARGLRRRAFPAGPTGTLEAMHTELVDPKYRLDAERYKREARASESRKRAKADGGKKRKRQRKRETPSERRRRLAAEALARR